MPTAYRLPPTAYCLPPTAYRLLPTAYCLPLLRAERHSPHVADLFEDDGDAFELARRAGLRPRRDLAHEDLQHRAVAGADRVADGAGHVHQLTRVTLLHGNRGAQPFLASGSVLGRSRPTRRAGAANHRHAEVG